MHYIVIPSSPYSSKSLQTMRIAMCQNFLELSKTRKIRLLISGGKKVLFWRIRGPIDLIMIVFDASSFILKLVSLTYFVLCHDIPNLKII